MTDAEKTSRPVRVLFPVRVSFAGDDFYIKEFSANLSVGGIFLATDRLIEVGSRGRLTFRVASWEKPFTVDAEVVRTVGPDHATEEKPSGIGLRFIDLSPQDGRRLERLVEGLTDGSVVEAIRRNVREGGKQLLHELRDLSTDQKVIFALFAQGQEIDALMRDGHPAALTRLLDNPRVGVTQVRKLLRDPRLKPSILLAVRKNREWMTDMEIRFLFCQHPATPLSEVLNLLPRLSQPHLQAMLNNRSLREPIRGRLKQLVKKVPPGLRG